MQSDEVKSIWAIERALGVSRGSRVCHIVKVTSPIKALAMVDRAMAGAVSEEQVLIVSERRTVRSTLSSFPRLRLWPTMRMYDKVLVKHGYCIEKQVYLWPSAKVVHIIAPQRSAQVWRWATKAGLLGQRRAGFGRLPAQSLQFSLHAFEGGVAMLVKRAEWTSVVTARPDPGLHGDEAQGC